MWDCLARSLRSWVVTSHWSRSSPVQVRCGRSARSTRLTCGRVIWGIFFPPVLLEGQQKGGGEQGQGEVMVPAGPTAHLVLVQARFALVLLEAGLHRPAQRTEKEEKLGPLELSAHLPQARSMGRPRTNTVQ